MKLQAKDLRIGNRVLRCGYLHEERNKFHEIVITHHDIVACYIDPEAFQPIPLTEEWLRRGGFEGDSITGAYVKYKLKSFEIWLDVAKNTFLLENIKNKKVYLPYVHDLQNAYHLIEGEEIEFNQTT